MPAAIEQNLIPQIIRDSVDPEILARAQSIEWSIARDIGEDEYGYLDNTGEDYRCSSASGDNFIRDNRKAKFIEWLDTREGYDSGLELTPTSPSLNNLSNRQLDESLCYQDGGYQPISGSIKSLSHENRDAQGQPSGPFPIYRVNQDQLLGEVPSTGGPGERTVHYETSSRIFNEEELIAMGIDPSILGPNSRATVDECEEEVVETSVIKSNRELEELCNAIGTDAGPYFERKRARSVSPSGSRYGPDEDKTYRTVMYESTDEVGGRDQEYFPYRDARQGKPLPGDNEYGASRFDNKRQWKLCNGQWLRVDDPRAQPKQEKEHILAERLKCVILLEPPPVPVEEIKVQPVTPIYVEMKRPLKEPDGEEEKLLEDPNLLWMQLGPAQYGPPFGTLKARKAREEEWIGPPCELCHKQIEERRCMLAENMKFHCWHYVCSFCMKTLKPSDFLIAELDNKPYCLNCHKREFPEISLAHLRLED